MIYHSPEWGTVTTIVALFPVSMGRRRKPEIAPAHFAVELLVESTGDEDTETSTPPLAAFPLAISLGRDRR
jgi:hypothetical protein